MVNDNNRLRAFAGFTIDLDKKVLWKGDAPVDLPFKAVELLCMLVERDGDLVEKEDLLGELWGDSFVEESVLPQNVYLLRKAFEKYGASRSLVETVPRRGYRFAGSFVSEGVESEVTIERTTVERRFYAEAEYVEDTVDGNFEVSQEGRFRRSDTSSGTGRYVRAGVLCVVLLGLFGASWIYNQQENRTFAPVTDSDTGRLDYHRLTDSSRAFSVALSPDGQQAAYVVHTPENKYKIVLEHLATGSKTEIGDPRNEHPHSIQFSPDGNYFYYAADAVGRAHTVFRMPIYGGPSEPVMSGLAHEFTLSPDGEWLAYLRQGVGESRYVEICRIKDCSEKRILAASKGRETFAIWGVAPSWSYDGKKLVVAGALNPKGGGYPKMRLEEIEVATGKKAVIRSPQWHRISQAYWKKDGSGLFVMVREAPGKPVQIWSVAYPSGEARDITNDDNDYRDFRLSPNSDFLVATIWKTNSNLYLVSSENPDDVKQLTFDDGVQNGEYGIKWTPDGQKIIYARTMVGSIGNLWAYDLNSGKSRQLTADQDSMQNYLDITSDGRDVYFGSNRGGKWNIWRIGVGGDRLRKVTDGDYEAAPEISPDGKYLYYTGGGLWKMPIEGGEPEMVMKETPGTTRVSPVDPDRLISYYGDPSEAEKDRWKFVTYSENDAENFEELDLKAFIMFEWKADGSGIYFMDRGESFNNLWFYALDNGKKTRLTSFRDQRISNLSLSPDGKTFVIARGQVINSVYKISGIR